MKKHLGDAIPGLKIYYSDQTWGNHPAIIRAAGLVPEAYPYWDPQTKGVKIEEWLKHMDQSRDGSVYLIHPVAHNPTGVDPSPDQWEKIRSMCAKKRHLVVLDCAYQ